VFRVRAHSKSSSRTPEELRILIFYATKLRRYAVTVSGQKLRKPPATGDQERTASGAQIFVKYCEQAPPFSNATLQATLFLVKAQTPALLRHGSAM